jgi:hypothetical protein
MMRSNLVRLAALGSLAAGVAFVASCDARLPTTATGTTGGTSTGGGTKNTKNAKPPTIVIDSPSAGTLVNVGDSILVTVRLHDDIGLKNATITGVTQSGSIDLGTFKESQRYSAVPIPVSGTFRTGLKDTTIRRFLQPLNKADTTLDSLVIKVIATDSLSLADTAQTRVNIVSGPKVDVTSPANGDSIPAGVGLSVTARAQHPDGINRIDIRVRGEATWPTKLDTTITQLYTTAPRDVSFSAVARIPLDAPVRSKITVTATAVDVNRQPGASAPVAAFVRAAGAAIPRVTQTVPPKTEFADSVVVRATGEAITLVGLIIRDSLGTIIQTDSLKLSPPFNANVTATIPLNLPPTLQGKKLGITAFAVDQAGRIGYAVPTTNFGSQGSISAGLVDSTLVVYGRTYQLPRKGTIGDIAVDAGRGNVFLSNTEFNLLEVWQQKSSTQRGFSNSGIAVGSLPWGLFVSNSPDTLLVANSGGTNISRVFIGASDAAQLHEDLANRILTRNTYVFTVTIQRDENTNKIHLTSAGPFSYSDRPQYIAQSKGGRIFYSTRPTTQAPFGTIRWLDPALPVPDPRQIWQYGLKLNTTQTIYALFNIDSIAIGATSPTALNSDTLFIWDHPYGQRTGVIQVQDTIPLNAISQAVAGGSDAEAVLRLDVASLGLTDTTFAAASGNRHWIAFGEGHTTGAGRTIMVADSTGPVPNFFSPVVTISDLTDNAAEKVFGLALDKSGGTVSSHGLQSYFSAVSDPFHLRLQGKFDSADDGAGIAFHPGADGNLTPQNQRVAFVAASNGSIEIVDVAYYIRRGRLPLKNSIYGPLRVSLPMAGDPPEVILKLYAVSEKGLVVIDLTAADIKPGP